MKRAQIFLALVLVLTFAVACGLSEAEMAQTSEAISGTINAQGTRTAKMEQTEAAVTQQYITEEAATAQAATATQIVSLTATADKATRQALAQQTLQAQTQIAAAEATEAVSEIHNVVQTLYDLGHITRKEGTHQQLQSFEEEFAQIGWYFIRPIPDSQARDFILLVDVSWASASKASEIKLSGCGISFRISEDGKEYYNFMLTLDGNMSFFAKLKDISPYLSKAYWGKLDYMEDSATFIITAEGNTFQVFNEEFKRIDLRNGSKLEEGFMAYQISSGINTDFGTRCSFTDVDLWRLDD